MLHPIYLCYQGQGQDQGCGFKTFSCDRTFDGITATCLSGDLVCDGERDCTYNEDESEFGCSQFLPSGKTIYKLEASFRSQKLMPPSHTTALQKIHINIYRTNMCP